MNPTRPTLSVVVPALNEEANIEAAVHEAIAAIRDRCADYELLLVNDGSTDRTGEIMDRLAAADPHLRVIHNPAPRNLGGVYKQAIAAARFDYLLMVPGDNENPSSALLAPLDAVGQADIVVPYPTNQRSRPWYRQLGSHGFTGLMNLLFGTSLRYFNGTVIHQVRLLRTIEIETDSFAYQSEALIKLLRGGASFVEVGIEIMPKPNARPSKALRPSNLVSVLRGVGNLFVLIHFGTARRARQPV